VSGSYVPNAELKAVENFGSDEGKGNQIVNYSVNKYEYQSKHGDFSYPGFTFNM
jgi:hypothetical protein